MSPEKVADGFSPGRVRIALGIPMSITRGPVS